MSNPSTKKLPPLTAPLEDEKEWETVNGPELIKWDKPGEILSGILISIGTFEIEGKRVSQLLLQLGTRSFRCTAPYDLRQKITDSFRGLPLRIKYLGQDENIRGGPNNEPMKVFSVQVKRTSHDEPNAHGVVVTDEDIPF
jgi:hypothetical protein